MMLVPVTRKSYTLYRRASRLLVRQLGSDAPSAETLIAHELSHRDPESIACEYADFLRARERRRKRGASAPPRRR